MNTPPPTCVYFVAVNPKQPSGGLSIFRTPVAVPVMFGDSPNITGAIASTNALGVGNGDPSQSGALSMVYVDQRWAGFADAAGKYLRSISFDASGSSATYGASATVQPSALRVLACIKS